MTTATTVGGQPGYTFSHAYDSTTGISIGLSNNAVGTANLATLSYNAQALVSSVNAFTSSGVGSALATDAFTYDATMVTAEAGKQAIGTLKAGQKVLAYTPKTHKMEEEPIAHVWKHTDDDVVDLTLTIQSYAHHSALAPRTSEVIHTNKKHPFQTIEQGFLAVSRITLEMHVERADGSVGVVTGRLLVAGTQTMYNLEVAQDHTFTVGDGQWIVHNCDAADWIKQLPKDPQELLDQGWRDVTDPSMKNRSEFRDPQTGRKVVFDKGVSGATGYKGVDHYHVYNPSGNGSDSTKYLDKNGNVVRDGSNPSHIFPQMNY